MLHRNSAPHALTFTLKGVSYDVPPGEEVNIPAHLAYAVPSRLVPVPGAAADPQEHVETIDALRDRVTKERARADAAEAKIAGAKSEAAQALADLAAERESREGFVSTLRKALSIQPGESILSAIEALKMEAATSPVAPPPKPPPQQAAQPTRNR